jgi:hypothetical protein
LTLPFKLLYSILWHKFKAPPLGTVPFVCQFIIPKILRRANDPS